MKECCLDIEIINREEVGTTKYRCYGLVNIPPETEYFNDHAGKIEVIPFHLSGYWKSDNFSIFENGSGGLDWNNIGSLVKVRKIPILSYDYEKT